MFDIHQSPRDANGERDEEASAEYCEGLTEAFADSPEGVAYADHHGSLRWAHSFLDYGFSYLGQTPPEMSLRDVKEILFSLIPRKVSVEADAAGEIVGELRAFWEFLGREYQLPRAAEILKELGRAAENRLRRELSNPANFGMAKSFFMLGQQMGYDMTTQEGMNQFMVAYNARQLARIAAEPDDEPTTYASPPAPTARRKSPLPQVALSRKDRKARDKLRRIALDKLRKKRS